MNKQLVRITWHDAESTDGWDVRSGEDIKERTIVFSTGYVVAMNEHSVLLAADIHPDEQTNRIMQIPLCCVINVCSLTIVKCSNVQTFINNCSLFKCSNVNCSLTNVNCSNVQHGKDGVMDRRSPCFKPNVDKKVDQKELVNHIEHISPETVRENSDSATCSSCDECKEQNMICCHTFTATDVLGEDDDYAEPPGIEFPDEPLVAIEDDLSTRIINAGIIECDLTKISMTPLPTFQHDPGEQK